MRTAALVAALLSAAALDVRAAGNDIDVPTPDPVSSIKIAADRAARWREGVYDVYMLEGNFLLQQGLTYAHSSSAVLWIDRSSEGSGQTKVIAYLEGDVEIDFIRDSGNKAKIKDSAWFGRFYTAASVDVRAPTVVGEPEEKPPLYHHAIVARDPNRFASIKRTQFEDPAAGGVRPGAGNPDAPPPGTRRLRAYRRSNVGVSIKAFDDPAKNELVAVVTGGINLVIDGVRMGNGDGTPGGGVDTIDIATDRMIIWTRGVEGGLMSAESFQSQDAPLEIYMEGNIEFRSGDRIIYADRMYYDVKNHTGTVLNAEVLTPAPGYMGLLRLKSDLVQQISEDRFVAQNAFVTSSRLGKPTYRLQTGTAILEDRQQVAIDPFTGAPQVDALGQPIGTIHEQHVTAQENFVYLGDLPVFYFPYFSSPMNDPVFYIESLAFGSDNIFGTQIKTKWDTYEVLGIKDPPDGTRWNFSIDYLSERGLGHGSKFQYIRPSPVTPMLGFIDYWGIKDDGTDNLGRNRRDVLPETDYRYRLLGQHRQVFGNGWQLSAEVGAISDRNFLEQYYEIEWDEFKDQTTGFELKKLFDNQSWNFTGDVRVNPFFTQTEGVELSHYWLGQDLFETFTWFEHSQAGYVDLEPARPYLTPESTPFALLPWETDVEGERFTTRQEIDLPFQFEEIRVVPYALGEAGHWGEALDGEPIDRLYGQLGVRASVPMWRVFPEIESELFNVHGIAHKVVFDAELSWTESNQDVEEFALYDPLDDDNVEHFRRRFAFDSFGVPPPAVPPQFDSRNYAIRSGIMGNVTSPVTEVTDDLVALRFGMRHRWQTKRGLPGQRHTVDFFTLDTNMTYFPKEDRDNFGEPIGLVDYDARWHVGDRVTLLSRGAFDFFDMGQTVVSVGTFINKPPSAGLAVGYTFIDGPIQSQILSGSVTYRLGPKYLLSFGSSVDFEGNRNIGQRFSLTRIGESFLVSIGGSLDASKGNAGLQLIIEPRFMPTGRIGSVAGAQLPPAGAFGLE